MDACHPASSTTASRTLTCASDVFVSTVKPTNDGKTGSYLKKRYVGPLIPSAWRLECGVKRWGVGGGVGELSTVGHARMPPCSALSIGIDT